jgi:hypothetical protein
MPLTNIPKHLQAKYERCVAHVKQQGGKKNPYAICYASVVGEGVRKEAGKRSAKK